MHLRVQVRNGQKIKNIEIYRGQSFMEALQENSIQISNLCHGNGTCGKCKIKVLSGYLPITESDKRNLSEDELKQGIRLACKAYIGEIQEADIEMLNEAAEDNILMIEIVSSSEDVIVAEGITVNENEMSDFEMKAIDGEAAKSIYEKRKIDIIKTDKHSEQEEKKEKYFIAIDIGSTTIAMALVNEETGEVSDTYTCLNHQRKYGADIISRITASNDGKAEELKKLIEEDLWRGICRLTKIESTTKENIDCKCIQDKTESILREITRIIISGNTTMVHLLMGYSCQSLGKYPFVSECLEQIECKWKECISFHEDGCVLKSGILMNRDNFSLKSDTKLNTDSICNVYENVSITILPAISTFVGGDITAGILNCPGFETKDICLLIDLGTNGEIVLGNKDKLLVTSTAAGPAFEGGNIIHGTASIPGSISQVKIQNQRAVVKTIKNMMPPVGICGTGLVSIIAQLIENKLIDREGNLRYPYNEKGFPVWLQNSEEGIKLYQKDIREFQMAKSAVRSGIEILMQEYRCQTREVKQVYLAGGFGTNLSVEDVIITGILPKEWKDRIVSIGNGALKGAIQVGLEKIQTEQRRENKELIKNRGIKVEFDEKKQKNELIGIENIIKRAENISLAEHKKFPEKYLKYMGF